MEKKTVVRKADLAAVVAKEMGISKTKAREAVDALFAGIMFGVKRGPVIIPDFGAFRIQHRRARKGRNPRTGEIIDIPSSTYPVFVAGKRVKELLKALKYKP